MLEMRETQRREEPDDLIQVPLFEATLQAAESGQTAAEEEGKKGFLKEKLWGSGGIRAGLVSCSFGLLPQGFRM